MKDKNVIFKFSNTPTFGGYTTNDLQFMVVDVDNKDVNILQPDGSIEHGFECKSIQSYRIVLAKVESINSTIEKLEFIVARLKEKRDGK